MRPDFQRILINHSVLDRLLDDDPKNPVEDQGALRSDIRAIKRAVARDIEALLNARSVSPDQHLELFPQSRNSMLDFGITDLSSLSLLDPSDRAYLRDRIRLTVERHEPRLSGVKVSLDAPAGTERMLRFRVDAVLEIVPTRPPVRFDARLQLSSNACQIKET